MIQPAIPYSSSFAVATENGTYEYSVYGQVAASDPAVRHPQAENHPNPYLLTGRRFDRETGLYYYRARYYNPYIGRFLQTDPVGYSDGINWYQYCRNNPLIHVDPSGRLTIIPPILDPRELIPGWNPRGEPPPLDGNWDWEDYFGWYLYGKGETVNLADTGLLDDLLADPQITKMMNEFESAIMSRAAKVYAENKELGLEHPGFRVGPLFYFETFEFDQPSDWLSWGLGLEGSEILVLGDTQVCMSAIGRVNDDGTYEITFYYSLQDEFGGVLAVFDFLDRWPFNVLEFGTPYEMEANWSNKATGSFVDEDEE